MAMANLEGPIPIDVNARRRKNVSHQNKEGMRKEQKGKRGGKPG
jgi:hypothetical protein